LISKVSGPYHSTGEASLSTLRSGLNSKCQLGFMEHTVVLRQFSEIILVLSVNSLSAKCSISISSNPRLVQWASEGQETRRNLDLKIIESEQLTYKVNYYIYA
jgi:hypothetical protein